jgi:prepilin-type N-terminal cleavage/methylation domain-containing protein
MKNLKKRKIRSAFTLIELLVVIAVIALLLSIVTPALKKAQDTAKRVVCGARLSQIGKAMKMYAEAFGGALPDDHNINGSRDRHGYVVYRDDNRYPNGILKPYRFAYLYELNYIETPEVFYCPGNRLDSYKYESYTQPAPWGSLPQDFNTNAETFGNQWVRIGYTYFPVERNARIDPSIGAPYELGKKFVQLNPKYAVCQRFAAQSAKFIPSDQNRKNDQRLISGRPCYRLQ